MWLILFAEPRTTMLDKHFNFGCFVSIIKKVNVQFYPFPQVKSANVCFRHVESVLIK